MGRTGMARKARAAARGSAAAVANGDGTRADWSGREQRLGAHRAGAGLAAGRGLAGERRKTWPVEGGRRVAEGARGCLWTRAAEEGNGSAVSGHP